ncbi:glycosyltransferase family 2 protein [Clostridium sp. ZBS14]|uniref:glycosyltransferase family 2 protein n=1 Tax=Clostridium sp. ZBS14 TaxID=2949970 RepID=UPI0003000A4B|nr:glycosyltransferase family 2 protein [Clostridium sp. ZBS14]
MKVKEILDKVQPIWRPNKNYDSIKPEVTVILPTFRRAKQGTFEKAVESVIKQKYFNWELIIVDDSSTDGTEDLIKFYMNLDNRINTIRNTYNLGLPAISEYQAYIKARGQYIAFIFDDNVWSDDHLLLSMKNMIKNNVKMTYGVARSFEHNGIYEDIDLPLEYLPTNNCIGNGGVVLHREVFETVGLYDPHLSLTRLCDWDLWQRIYKKYLMFKIDEVVTLEYGVSLPDSLGNTIKMNAWVSYEQIQTDRNEQLLPSNFEDYDIISIQDDSTDLFYEYLNIFYDNYKDKCWYVHEEISEFIRKKNAKRRIALELSSLDATYFIGFSSFNSHFIIRPFIGDIPSYDYLYSDIVLCVRDAYKGYNNIKFNNKFNIPTFYYTDDNFIDIMEEKKIKINENKHIELISNILKSNNMHEFKGIIVSTNPLKQDFEDRDMNNKLVVLPPSVEIPIEKKFNVVTDQVNIAFIGGKFREDIFISKIFPALIKLSQKININLVCTESLKEKIDERKFNFNSKLTIENIDINHCYEQFILDVERHNINFLIHSGEEHPNNKYKTNNCLINAVKLGALIITSDIDPYKNLEEIITSKNTIESWYSVLDKLIIDKDMCEKQYYIQKQYVLKNYSIKNGINSFNEIFENIESKGVVEILDKFQKASFDQIEKKDIANTYNNIINYDFLDRICSYREINRKVIYRIKPHSSFSSIGIIISSDTDYNSGTIQVNILDSKNEIVATCKKEIQLLQMRTINYFNFHRNIRCNRGLKLEIIIRYSNGGRIGVYEVKSKANKVYRGIRKVFNKDLPIKNVVFYEI